ncbi:phage tail protein [Enterobacter bugandensis]|nr:phage tail protein [Enterobacter bugandensis]
MKIDPFSLIASHAREQVLDHLNPMQPLLMWGAFIFQLDTLAYSKLNVQESWRWASQGRIGRRDKLQFTGKPAPTITFDCELYEAFLNPSFLAKQLNQQSGLVHRLGLDPVEHLRLQAESRTPMMLVSGSGKVMGYWVMTDMKRVLDVFRQDGTATHQVVTLTMQFYDLRLTEEEPLQLFAELPGTTKEEKLQGILDDMREAIGGEF